MTPKQLHILRHTLGLDRAIKPYRNYYVAGDGVQREIDQLVKAGLMMPIARPAFTSDQAFRATSSGRAVAMRSTRELRRGVVV